MSFVVAIPARFSAARLPGKLLLDLGGQPVIRRTVCKALGSGARQVLLATDDERIAAAVRDLDVTIAMPAGEFESGTDRLAAALTELGLAPETVVVNLQGDEPLMPGELLAQVAALLEIREDADVATLCQPLGGETEADDPAVVKIVTDLSGMALYFSRAPIPWPREGRIDYGTYRRHLGLYAYRLGFLHRFAALPAGRLEQLERLEQLRALEHGYRIAVADAEVPCGPGIDTQEDLERAAALLA